jgi:drug/metabolite transporter (DMT)-like permease
MASDGIPPPHAALSRFVFGSAGLLAVMLVNRPWPGINRELAWKLAAMGFFGVFLYNLCFFTGLRTVPAGRASLMASLQPSVVFLFSAVVWGERATGLKLTGLGISFFGALLVLSQGDPRRLFTQGVNTGDLWVLGCVLSWVAYTLLGRTVSGRVSSGAATAYSTWFGTALLAAVVFVQPVPMQPWSWTSWMSAVFLGLGGTTVGFLLFLRGLAQIGASRTSIFINLVPVFGVLFSALLLGESLGGATLLGGAFVIAGVRLLNR